MRQLIRPSTAHCTLGHYIGMLISEPKHPTCTRLAQSIDIGHDSINNFLGRENYEPRDLYDQAIAHINPIGGIISIDDTVLDKPYSNKTDFIGYYDSGKHHKAVKGINLITLYYTDRQGNSQPINHRLYDHKDKISQVTVGTAVKKTLNTSKKLS